MPRMPFMGVRISWLMLARNSLLARWQLRRLPGALEFLGDVAAPGDVRARRRRWSASRLPYGGNARQARANQRSPAARAFGYSTISVFPVGGVRRRWLEEIRRDLLSAGTGPPSARDELLARLQQQVVTLVPDVDVGALAVNLHDDVVHGLEHRLQALLPFAHASAAWTSATL